MKPANKKLHEANHIATQVAGIIYWAMIVSGVLISAMLFTQMSGYADTEIQLSLASVKKQTVDACIEKGCTSVTADDLEAIITDKEHILYLTLITNGKDLQAGQPVSEANKWTGEIDKDLGGYARIVIGYKSVNAIFGEEIRFILLAIGVLVFVAAAIVKHVLTIIVTTPFTMMVETAKDIVRGDESVRFPEGADNEFGYLSRFMNLSLEHLSEQRKELEKINARLKDSEIELSREKEIAEVTLHSIGDAVITTNKLGEIEYLNPVAETVIGLVSEDIIGKHIDEAINVQPGVQEGDSLIECLTTGKAQPSMDRVLTRPDKRLIEISLSSAPIINAASTVLGAIIVFQDVTPTRKLARQLAFEASHDPLTGLYNRREFESHVVAALNDAKANKVEHAVCFLDIDQFKLINDTCGHSAGDDLLKQVSMMINNHIRDTDILARLGGDELGLLLAYCSAEKASEVSQEILGVINKYRFTWKENEFDVKASIGVASITMHSHTVEEVLSAADVACYAAKEAGRNRVHLYEEDDLELEARKGEMKWVAELASAINEDRFKLYLQPIKPIQNNKDAQKYEVLIRLQSKDNVIGPEAFIGAAERYGMMPSIDRWVIKNTFKFIGETIQAHEQGEIFSINLSGQSLTNDNLYEFINECIESYSVPAGNVCFEITETATIANLSKAVSLIHKLKELGCKFSLDDFGTGLSSFAYLKTLSVDYLKVDGSFVKDMHKNETDRSMVSAINQVGKDMGIQTIAEYVENEETVEALIEIGVDYAQGHYISMPFPINEYRPLITDCN